MPHVHGCEWEKGGRGRARRPAIRILRFAPSLILVLSLSPAVLADSISCLPSDPNVEQAVTFTYLTVGGPASFAINWDFGDGTSQVSAAGVMTVSHAYRAAKTYTVTATRLGMFGVPSTTTTISVVERRSLSYLPSGPTQGRPVTFVANHFLSPSILWDFGDGTILAGGDRQVHVFRTAGEYRVVARDMAGRSVVPISVLVMVGETPAIAIRIGITPPNPRVGETITFTAGPSIFSQLRWEFGDGSSIAAAGPQVTHVYAKEGPWTVRAYDDWGSGASGTLILMVYPAFGPRSPFAVSYIALRFEDGKSYKVVPRNSGNLTAYADFKYEGTGILQARWMLDGLPFRTVSLALPFAGQATISSNQLAGLPPPSSGSVPGLPTTIPGLHEVTLNLVSPDPGFAVPVIRYFVTVDEAPAKAVDLVFSGSRDLDGAVLPSDADSIEAPSGRYFLLDGRFRNEGRDSVPSALFRVFLDDELVDQKFVRRLLPGEERAFRTSVFNPSGGDKKLVFVLYDISRKPAPVLFFREMTVLSPRR